MDALHRSAEELAAGLDTVRAAPRERGTVEMIVARPERGERAVLAVADLDLHVGLAGDNWLTRGSRSTPDGSAELGRQLTLMSTRAAALIAGPRERWPLAGDQLYVDLDLSCAALPAGTRLRVGSAEIEVSVEPHTGCAKFTERFGVAAIRLVQSEVGSELRLRGVNARVVVAGRVQLGDAIEALGRYGTSDA